MGEKSEFTRVVEETVEQMLGLQSELQQLGAVPFMRETISAKQQRARYDAMTPDQMQAFVAEKGPDEVGRWIQDMEVRKLRYGRGGGDNAV